MAADHTYSETSGSATVAPAASAHEQEHRSLNMISPNPPHPLDNVTDADSNRGTVLQMQTGLFELGRNRSLGSGTTEPTPGDLRALEDHARAMARDTYRDAFDPALHQQDAMHKAEYDRDVAARQEAENGEAHATANLRDAEMKRAKTPSAGPQPGVKPWLVVAFIITISITCAPTLHDFLFYNVGDDLLAWFCSLLFSGFLGGMLTLAIISGRRSSLTWIGVAAGIVLGIGLGAVRLSSAKGLAEGFFAIGLTIVEIASVLLLEWLASGIRNSEQRWEGLKSAEDEALNCVAAAQTDLARWQARVHELDQKIHARISMVEDRHLRNIHLPELEALAVKAVHDGYFAGIAENVGRLRGVGRRIQ
jgi:hypothetical protein